LFLFLAAFTLTGGNDNMPQFSLRFMRQGRKGINAGVDIAPFGPASDRPDLPTGLTKYQQS